MKQKKSTILIAENEPQTRKLLRSALEEHGYKTITVESGKEAIRLTASVKPDLLLLDTELSDMDGNSVLRSIREWSQIPIIVCSVHDEDSRIIESFKLGADDYITKPFNPDILLVHINANMRKLASAEAGEPMLVNGDISMDLVRHEVFIKGEKCYMTPKEYELLRYFMVNKRKMLTHRQILKNVWGSTHVEDMQYLRVYISQLRSKIEQDPYKSNYIVTHHGIGYMMESHDPPESPGQGETLESSLPGPELIVLNNLG
jgi:two-component system KDP operon response regulator KdpE